MGHRLFHFVVLSAGALESGKTEQHEYVPESVSAISISLPNLLGQIRNRFVSLPCLFPIPPISSQIATEAQWRRQGNIRGENLVCSNACQVCLTVHRSAF